MMFKDFELFYRFLRNDFKLISAEFFTFLIVLLFSAIFIFLLITGKFPSQGVGDRGPR